MTRPCGYVMSENFASLRSGGITGHLSFAMIPACSREVIRENLSAQQEVQIWDIYNNYNRVNRCALAEQHCYDRAEDPFNCHRLEL